MKVLLALLVIAIAPCRSSAIEFKLIHRHGKPIRDRDKAYKARILYASWIDEDNIAFISDTGRLNCLSVATGKIKWSIDGTKEIRDWSLSRKTKRLAYMTKNLICIVDCTTGKPLFAANRHRLARLLRVESVVPTCIALSPNDGRLFVCDFSFSYGRNGYVLDASYRKRVATFDVDARAGGLSVSPDGQRVALIAYEDVLSVRDLTKNRDVFFLGKRIVRKPESLTTMIDTAFFSHIRHDGHRIVVYTQDSAGSGTGTVFVCNIATKKVKKLDARNGHIEVDVDYRAQRIVLTGTSTNLTLVDFDGKVLADAKAITTQRNLCVEFSPSGKRVLVGSWDNTLQVFKIVE